MNQPKWTELRAKNLTLRRGKIAGTILHDTAGSATHNDTLYLANPGDGRPVSVDFTVERDGSIWKLNPDLEKYCCSHAGRKTKFKGFVNGQVNQATVGIEIVQKANLSLTPVYTPEQVKSVAELCAWLTEKFNLETSDITTHRNIITDGSRSDPRNFPFEGPNGFWQFYWEAKGRGEVHEAAREIQKIPEEDKAQYVVEPGDGFYKIAKKLGVDAKQLAAANGMTLESPIIPGQVLSLYGVKKKA